MQFVIFWTDADGKQSQEDCESKEAVLDAFKRKRASGAVHIVASQIGDDENGSEDEVLAYYDPALGDL